MKYALLLFAVASCWFSPHTRAQDRGTPSTILCTHFNHLNCTLLNNHEVYGGKVCASDGQTYMNLCFFHQEQCKPGNGHLRLLVLRACPH